LPLMPLLLTYAAAAVVHRSEIWQARRSWQFKAAALTYAILAGSWVWEIAVVERARIKELACEASRTAVCEVQALSNPSRQINS
jgi:hypothetical protein